MAEQQVPVEGRTRRMDARFFVSATETSLVRSLETRDGRASRVRDGA
jgi:hypothetical protein